LSLLPLSLPFGHGTKGQGIESLPFGQGPKGKGGNDAVATVAKSKRPKGKYFSIKKWKENSV